MYRGTKSASGVSTSSQQKEFPHCIPDGIFVMQEECKPGDDIKPVVGLDDHVVEFEITPNRPDCLSGPGRR